MPRAERASAAGVAAAVAAAAESSSSDDDSNPGWQPVASPSPKSAAGTSEDDWSGGFGAVGRKRPRESTSDGSDDDEEEGEESGWEMRAEDPELDDEEAEDEEDGSAADGGGKGKRKEGGEEEEEDGEEGTQEEKEEGPRGAGQDGAAAAAAAAATTTAAAAAAAAAASEAAGATAARGSARLEEATMPANPSATKSWRQQLAGRLENFMATESHLGKRRRRRRGRLWDRAEVGDGAAVAGIESEGDGGGGDDDGSDGGYAGRRARRPRTVAASADAAAAACDGDGGGKPAGMRKSSRNQLKNFLMRYGVPADHDWAEFHGRLVQANPNRFWLQTSIPELRRYIKGLLLPPAPQPQPAAASEAAASAAAPARGPSPALPRVEPELAKRVALMQLIQAKVAEYEGDKEGKGFTIEEGRTTEWGKQPSLVGTVKWGRAQDLLLLRLTLRHGYGAWKAFLGDGEFARHFPKDAVRGHEKHFRRLLKARMKGMAEALPIERQGRLRALAQAQQSKAALRQLTDPSKYPALPALGIGIGGGGGGGGAAPDPLDEVAALRRKRPELLAALEGCARVVMTDARAPDFRRAFELHAEERRLQGLLAGALRQTNGLLRQVEAARQQLVLNPLAAAAFLDAKSQELLRGQAAVATGAAALSRCNAGLEAAYHRCLGHELPPSIRPRTPPPPPRPLQRQPAAPATRPAAAAAAAGPASEEPTAAARMMPSPTAAAAAQGAASAQAQPQARATAPAVGSASTAAATIAAAASGAAAQGAAAAPGAASASAPAPTRPPVVMTASATIAPTAGSAFTAPGAAATPSAASTPARPQARVTPPAAAPAPPPDEIEVVDLTLESDEEEEEGDRPPPPPSPALRRRQLEEQQDGEEERQQPTTGIAPLEAEQQQGQGREQAPTFMQPLDPLPQVLAQPPPPVVRPAPREQETGHKVAVA